MFLLREEENVLKYFSRFHFKIKKLNSRNNTILYKFEKKNLKQTYLIKMLVKSISTCFNLGGL